MGVQHKEDLGGLVRVEEDAGFLKTSAMWFAACTPHQAHLCNLALEM